MREKPPLKKNDTLTLDITALGSQGQGIGRVEGYAVFVPGALPGEHIKAHIIKVKSTFAVGKLQEVLAASPQRVEPKCPLFSKCGGCMLQHCAYPAQLLYKKQVVQDAFSRIGGMEGIDVRDVVGMEAPYRYRNKASIPLSGIDGRVELGFFAAHSHRIVPMEDCFLQEGAIMAAARAVRDWANTFGVMPYDEEQHKGLLRHIVLRRGSTGEMMAIIVATKPLPHSEQLISLLRERTEGLKSVYLNINAKRTNVIHGDDYTLLWGEERIAETLSGISLSLGPASFLQVNHAQAERLYRYAVDALKLNGDEHVIDAYCGIGSITLLLAGHAKEVVGLENEKQAVEDARRNALANGIENTRFLCGAAEKLLPELLSGGFVADALVLDPPRKGADEAFLQAVLSAGIPKIAYVSCDPATLARDCKFLAAGGYRVEYVRPVDMFPETTHVECVALLTRKDG